jgi:hypothetical protein
VEKTDKKAYIKFQMVPNLQGGNDIVIIGYDRAEGEDAQRQYESQHKGLALVLPPGMDDPDKYLIKADPACK